MATLHVFFQPQDVPQPPPEEECLLVFGSCRERDDLWIGTDYELDSEIDCRHGWIDDRAAELAEKLACPSSGEVQWKTHSEQGRRLCYLHALKLRYHLVALLRLVVFLDAGTWRWKQLLLHDSPLLQEGWWELLQAWAAARGKRLHRAESPGGRNSPPRHSPSSFAGRAKRSLARFAPCPRALLEFLHRFHRTLRQRKSSAAEGTAWLCGNPRLLAPLAPELCRRGTTPLWLFPRLALRWWGVSLRHGRGQWCYESGIASPLAESEEPPQLARLEFRGLNLAGALNPWLARRWRQDHLRLRRVEASLRRAWRKFPPRVVLLDEDATALKRLLVQLAREHRVPSVVVQHGVPRVRFGFAPPAADALCLWGNRSQEQLHAWGVPQEKLFVTGSPAHDELFAPGGRFHSGQAAPVAERVAGAPLEETPFRVLLLATTRPRPLRPEPAAFHLTLEEYQRLLFLAVEEVLRWPQARLTIKLHPRDADARWYRQFVPEEERHRVRIESRRTLWHLLPEHHLVLHIASGAGVEAALAGWPVVELLPQGGSELLPAKRWGMLGTARSPEQLHRYLRRWLKMPRGGAFGDCKQVMANFSGAAAPRVVEVALQLASGGGPRPAPSTSSLQEPREPAPCSRRASAVQEVAR